MLTILAKCSHSCLLICLCGNREYPVSFQNKLVSSSFPWVPKYILFPWPNWREKENLFGMGKCTVLSLGEEGNVSYYKSAHHPIPTQGNREHPGNFQNKSVSFPFNWASRYILFLPKLKGRGRLFLRGARRGTALWYYPQEYLVVIRDEKVSPFVKFETILPVLCFLLAPLTNW